MRPLTPVGEGRSRCRYCVRNYDAQRDESREVFLMLLRVYLKPSGNEPIQVQPALRVLTDHHSKMDPAKVCSVPDTHPGYMP